MSNSEIIIEPLSENENDNIYSNRLRSVVNKINNKIRDNINIKEEVVSNKKKKLTKEETLTKNSNNNIDITTDKNLNVIDLISDNNATCSKYLSKKNQNQIKSIEYD